MFNRIIGSCYPSHHSGPAVALASLASLGIPGPAQATDVTPFTITEYVDFTGGGANNFIATGPSCAAGTFADDVQTEGPSGGAFSGPEHSGGENLPIRTMYTCVDGSGSSSPSSTSTSRSPTPV